MKIMIINGPNINMIGVREKGIYGTKSFEEICSYIRSEGEKRGHDITLLQSNCEGKIIDFMQDAYFEKYDGVVINPGAYTHYSYAIHDAIKGNTGIPTVEVHLSNVHAREDFRKESKTAAACIGQIAGFGEKGYILAIEALEDYKEKNI
ncbi:type II 3-dehydroquinate dehydratase [Clostridium sardiniense]|uniref:type II 3-dehydroquinate dehydratase n=1 Tax=Clostridium sardiniense TaxID=29369 RepID=UPI003D3460F9